MNTTLKEYVSSYVSPVKIYYLSLEDALAVWGQTIYPEDLIDG